MVKVGVNDKNEVHINVDTFVTANTSRCMEKVDAK
jgi:hypothetical protein